MNANYSTPARVKLSAFIGAVVASVVILGSTVAGTRPPRARRRPAERGALIRAATGPATRSARPAQYPREPGFGRAFASVCTARREQRCRRSRRRALLPTYNGG